MKTNPLNTITKNEFELIKQISNETIMDNTNDQAYLLNYKINNTFCDDLYQLENFDNRELTAIQQILTRTQTNTKAIALSNKIKNLPISHQLKNKSKKRSI